jgi:hypothetical protein
MISYARARGRPLNKAGSTPTAEQDIVARLVPTPIGEHDGPMTLSLKYAFTCLIELQGGTHELFERFRGWKQGQGGCSRECCLTRGCHTIEDVAMLLRERRHSRPSWPPQSGTPPHFGSQSGLCATVHQDEWRARRHCSSAPRQGGAHTSRALGAADAPNPSPTLPPTAPPRSPEPRRHCGTAARRTP